MTGSENNEGSRRVKAVVWIVLFAWLAVVLILGAGGDFARSPGAPPLPILAGVLIPIIVFFAAFLLAGSFRRFVMSLDL